MVEGFRKRNYAISSNRAKSVYGFIYSNERSPKHWATLQERESSNLVYVWQMARPPAPSCFYKHWEKALSLRPLCGRQLTHPGNINTHKGKADRLSHFFEVFSRNTILHVGQSNARASHSSLKYRAPYGYLQFREPTKVRRRGHDPAWGERVFTSGLNYGSKTRGRECGS